MRGRAVLLVFMLVYLLSTSWIASAASEDDPESLERQIKAAYLYKFAGFVDWPDGVFPSPDTPITIAVAGSERFAAELARAITGRTINNRQLAVRHIKAGEPLADAAQILFVERQEQQRLGQFVRTARPRSVLVVSESNDALAQGSVINFIISERRVRFEISLDAAEKSRLRLSSRLLAVAEQVVRGTR
jgi:hypothetical protein